MYKALFILVHSTFTQVVAQLPWQTDSSVAASVRLTKYSYALTRGKVGKMSEGVNSVFSHVLHINRCLFSQVSGMLLFHTL